MAIALVLGRMYKLVSQVEPGAVRWRPALVFINLEYRG